MEWYVVVKTIKGRRYRYWQKTYRVGRSVKTLNKYIGPDTSWRAVRVIDPSASTLPLPFPTAATIGKETVQAVFHQIIERQPKTGWSRAWNLRKKKNDVIRNPTIDDILTRLNVVVTRDPKGAYFAPVNDVLNIPPQEMFTANEINTASQRYYRTVCHELIHWTGHRDRLNRLEHCFTSRIAYAREELVAEAGALILMTKLGFAAENIDVHAAYFKGWLTSAGNTQEALDYAQKEAERAVNYILYGTS